MERTTYFDMLFGVTHVDACMHTNLFVVSGNLQGCEDEIRAEADGTQAGKKENTINDNKYLQTIIKCSTMTT